jgi:predicted RNA binding protein YcfA (HicA-like mRNA interferase family)
MNHWSSTKAKKVLAALEKLGWQIKRQTGSHKILKR